LLLQAGFSSISLAHGAERAAAISGERAEVLEHGGSCHLEGPLNCAADKPHAAHADYFAPSTLNKFAKKNEKQ